jgi:NAD(P)-dependent dehydrogenase (short-subunit alcohol dehydrogenase family)
MTKTILITGAASGFGRDTAQTLAARGHGVFASMRDVAGRNAAAASALEALGVAVVELDVTDDSSVDAAVATVLARAGRIDVLVNNAGMASAGVSEAFTADQAKVLFCQTARKRDPLWAPKRDPFFTVFERRGA